MKAILVMVLSASCSKPNKLGFREQVRETPEKISSRAITDARALSSGPRLNPRPAAMAFRHAAAWVDTGVACATLQLNRETFPNKNNEKGRARRETRH
jgi:hypothetical protein